MSYQEHSLGESYPSAEIQSVYFAAPSNWAKTDSDLFSCITSGNVLLQQKCSALGLLSGWDLYFSGILPHYNVAQGLFNVGDRREAVAQTRPGTPKCLRPCRHSPKKRHPRRLAINLVLLKHVRAWGRLPWGLRRVVLSHVTQISGFPVLMLGRLERLPPKTSQATHVRHCVSANTAGQSVFRSSAPTFNEMQRHSGCEAKKFRTTIVYKQYPKVSNVHKKLI